MARPQSASGRMTWIDLATLLVLAGAVALGVRSGSPLRSEWAQWKSERALLARIADHWPALVEAATRLYAGSRPPELIEVLDYQCPFCRKAAPAVDSLTNRGVRIGILHLPLPIHPNARAAALTALCAAREGEFRAMHAQLLGDASWHEAAGDSAARLFHRIASDSGIQACVKNTAAEVSGLLLRHERLAGQLGVETTPLFIGPGGMHRGVATVERLLRLARR